MESDAEEFVERAAVLEFPKKSVVSLREPDPDPGVKIFPLFGGEPVLPADETQDVFDRAKLRLGESTTVHLVFSEISRESTLRNKEGQTRRYLAHKVRDGQVAKNPTPEEKFESENNRTGDFCRKAG
jgi:hypothetical protein